MGYRGYTIIARVVINDFDNIGSGTSLKVEAGEYDTDSFVVCYPDGDYCDTLEPGTLEDIKAFIDEDIAKEAHIER